MKKYKHIKIIEVKLKTKWLKKTIPVTIRDTTAASYKVNNVRVRKKNETGNTI